MRKQILFTIICCCMMAIQSNTAQNQVTTLQHKGGTKVFYGLSSLKDAYTASVNGDTLYLSTGNFSAPTSIAKGLKIIGAGHFPDSAEVTRRTIITGRLTVSLGADSLRLEGLYINSFIIYDAGSPINYVKVIRCFFTGASFNSTTATDAKNNCSFEECFVEGNIDFNSYGDNLLVRNSIISGLIRNINRNALIDGNIFTNTTTSKTSSTLYNVDYSEVRNNIFYVGAYSYSGCPNSKFNKNMFLSSSFTITNNYTISSAASSIFKNITTDWYSSDYHLKTPQSYPGTDGTQVGIYGGQSFKEKGTPSNPTILYKTIAPRTDANGNLQISFQVKAQDN